MTGGPAGRARQAARLVDLVQQAGRGDCRAFADLYDETSPSVYGMALSVARSPRLASILTEEVYAEAWRKATRYDPSEGTVLAWLMTLAHRHFVERVRTMSKESVPERFAVLNGDREFHDVGRNGGSKSEAEPARWAWYSVSATDRKALTLAYFGGYSQTEVARILGQSVGTVQTSIRDGLVALRAAMGGRS